MRPYSIYRKNFKRELNADRSWWQSDCFTIIISLIAATIDSVVLYELLDSVIYESQILIIVSVASTCLVIDLLIPILLSHNITQATGGSKTVTNVILITSFILINVVLTIIRFQNREAIIGTTEGLLVNTMLSTNESQNVDSGGVFVALFLSFIPILTSIAVFILGVKSYDPNKAEKNKKKAKFEFELFNLRLEERNQKIQSDVDDKTNEDAIEQKFGEAVEKLRASELLEKMAFRELLATKLHADPIEITNLSRLSEGD